MWGGWGGGGVEEKEDWNIYTFPSIGSVGSIPACQQHADIKTIHCVLYIGIILICPSVFAKIDVVPLGYHN